MVAIGFFDKFQVYGVSKMNFYEAICSRKSVRRYSMKPLTQDHLDEILHFANSLPMLFPNIKVEFKILDCSKDKLRKKYFDGVQFVKAPYYLILSSTKEDGYYINAGYLMQQVSLYMTSKNIGSCYQGALKLHKEFDQNTNMENVIILAFGEGKSNIYRRSGKVKRLPEEDVVIYKEEVSESIKTILKAGREAPSSMNNQPWRFVVYQNRIHVFCKKNLLPSNQVSKMKLIDIGIALSNMLVVIDEMWIDVEVYRSNNISKQDFKKNDYMISLKLGSEQKCLR